MMNPLDYVVLVPIVGAAGPAGGCYLVRSNHAAEAVTAARARCLRPGDFDWTRAVACVKDTVLDGIRKGV